MLQEDKVKRASAVEVNLYSKPQDIFIYAKSFIKLVVV